MRTLQEIEPGQVLGRYEFLVPIAEGGMASVWAARLKGSRGFSKTVAIKTMLPGVSDDPAFEQMFLDEAQIASRIRHPNVAEILDLGEQEEVLFLVMEYVDGEPLANLRRAAAKHGGVPRPIAVRLVADACAGLHAAHELKDEGGQLVGLVHRDMSPQNLLVTFDGVVKIVDFGVAKAAGRSSEQTNAGQVKGKPPYMSPEQALGEVVDRRTDVFALGIILYQLTTGKHPFRGESDLVTLQNIVSDKAIVSPRAYDKQYPRKLESVVMKALDRRREHRFQTCAQLESALEDVFDKEVPRARTDDVGKFVTEMLGARGEQRRRALGDSIRMADERAAGGSPVSQPRRVIGTMPGSLNTPASGKTFSLVNPRRDGRLEGTDPTSVHATPLGSSVAPPSASKRGRVGIVLVALLVAASLGAVAALRPSAKADDAPLGAPHAAAAPRDVHDTPAAAETAALPPVPSEGAQGEPAAEASAEAMNAQALRKPKSRAGHARPPTTSAPVAAALPASPAPKPAAAIAPAARPAAPAKPPGKSAFVPPPVSDPGF